MRLSTPGIGFRKAHGQSGMFSPKLELGRRVFTLILSVFIVKINFCFCERSMGGNANSSSQSEDVGSSVQMLKELNIGSRDVFNDTLAFDKQSSFGIVNKIADLRTKRSVSGAYKSFDDFDFVKQSNDKNKYSFITLSNEIQLFLVSHYSVKLPTVSVSVRAGTSMEDDKFPGVASLLSEIMFSNWKKKSNNLKDSPYDKYVSNNNGRFEIKVGSFRTEYYLTIKPEHFEDALMDFGNTLKSPKLNRIYLEHSLEELDSAFQLAKRDQRERLRQVFRDISSEDHVNHGFNFASKDALKRDSNNDKEHLIFQLVKFHSTYYSSNMLSICIVSDKSLEELKNYAKIYLEDIPNFKTELITPFYLSGNVDHPYLNLRRKMVQVKSFSETPYLTLIFPIPHQTVFWRFKPTEYISFFLTNYSSNSLFGYLKKSGYIDSIEARAEVNDNGFSNYIIKYTLCSKSERNILRIMEMTLSFIKLIKEVPISGTIVNQIKRKRQNFLEKGIFDKISNTRDSYEYNHMEKLSRVILDSYLTNNCSPVDVLRAPTCMNRIDFKYVVNLLDYITYDNMIVLLEKKEFKKSGSDLLLSNSDYYDGRLKRFKNSFSNMIRFIKSHLNNSPMGVYPNYLSSEYFGTKYTLEDIPPSVVAKLSNVNITLANGVGRLEMPNLDPNYPKDLQIYTRGIKLSDYPLNLYSELRKIDTENGTNVHLGNGTNSLSSVYYLGTPIELGDLLVALNSSKLSYYTRKVCYFPTKLGSDILVYAKLYLPENIPRDMSNCPFNKTIEKLTITFYIYQYCLHKFLQSTDLKSIFVFKENYSLWELQEFFYGLEFNWRGFTAVFPDIIGEIADILIEFEKHIKQSLLTEAKNKFRSMTDGFRSENENLRIMAISYELLDPGFLSIDKLENELRSVDLQTVIKFSKFFNSNFALSGSVFGNVTPVQTKYYLTRFVRTTRQMSPDLFPSKLENQTRLSNAEEDTFSDVYEDEIRDGDFILTNSRNSSSHEVNSEFRKLRSSESAIRDSSGKSSNKSKSDSNNKSRSKTNALSTNAASAGVSKEELTKGKKELSEGNHSSQETDLKMNNLENRVYLRNGSYNDINKLPYNYSSSYFYYENKNRNSRLNIVLLQIYIGYYSEANYAMLQVLSELNSYEYFLEYSKSKCHDCSLTILPRIVLSKYILLEFKLQSLVKNVKELGELLNGFYQDYYSRPTKMISRSKVQKAIDFVKSISANGFTGAESLENYDFVSDLNSSEDLYSIFSYHLGILKHVQISCDWRKYYNQFLYTLTYERFFTFWKYLRTSSRIMISHQSQYTNSELLEYIESYIPHGYTKVSSISGLHEINEQQLSYPS